MGTAAITVEAVEARTQLRRFADVPFVLHGDDPRWRPPLRAWDQWRLDARRHPYFDRGDAAYLLARRVGRPVGRIAAHVPTADATDGWFGFFDAPDDADVVTALLDAAQEWLSEQGATSMTGPVSWTPDEEFGVVVAGHEHPAITGRAWQPDWYAARLTAAGMFPGESRPTYRLDTAELTDAPVPSPAAPDGDVPPHVGRYADRALVLDRIAAVPDISSTLAEASLRSAWKVARQAGARSFETAVCVRCDGDPAELVPRLAGAAGAAGYRWLLAPWSPGDTPPERVHQVFTRDW